MQPDTSKSTAVAKIRTRRSFTDARKVEILAYCDQHGVAATMKKFGLVNSIVHRWLKDRSNGKLIMDVKVVSEPAREKANMLVYHTAKHIRMLLRKRRKETEEPDELEVYSWLLVKEILG